MRTIIHEYERNVKNMFEIAPEEAHPGMYRVVWPDGQKSADFYNYDRCSQFRRMLQHNTDYRGIDAGPEKAAGAFKSVPGTEIAPQNKSIS